MSELRAVGAGQKPADHDPERLFLAWSFLRAIPHHGYVLVSSLYFVLVAGLSASHLVLLGTAMAVTLLFCDIPVGQSRTRWVADGRSRSDTRCWRRRW